MEHQENKDQNSGSSEKQGYQSSMIDLKFLKAADHIIQRDKKAKRKPNSDSAISNTLFGSRTVIGKIRAHQRGITIPQLQKFAIHYDLDLNYFFRNTESMFYNPQAAGKNQNMGIAGERVDIVNEMNNSTLHRGNVYHGNEIENVDKMMQNALNPQDMELQAGAMSEDVKKIIQGYQEKLRIVTEQRDQAKAKHIEISEKYITLLEKNMGT